MFKIVRFIQKLFTPGRKATEHYFETAVNNVYLPQKIRNSQRLLDQPRRPLPVLGHAVDGEITLDLADAVNKQCGQLVYKADPISGLLDLYNHPEHTQYLAETHDYKKSSNDCDDFATYAQGLFHAAGVSPENHWEWNILISPFKQWKQAQYNHVICGFRMGGWYGIIDTNTAARGQVFWFEGDLKSVKKQVIQAFNGIYNADYYRLIKGRWFELCYPEQPENQAEGA